MAKRISIINFKGGVGKTTVAFHLATGLARFYKKRVLLIDLDHQSSLSLVCLDEDQWIDASHQGKTVNSIFTHFTSPGIPLPNKQIVLTAPKNGYPTLDLLASELQLDETELDLGTFAMGDAVLSKWNKRMLIAKWMDSNNIDQDYDYVIFDCPPATKIVTQNAIAVSQGFIVPAIPDEVSTRGIPHLIERMLTKINGDMAKLSEYLKMNSMSIDSAYVPETKFLGLIVFRIRTHGPAASGYLSDHTAHLRFLQRKYGKLLIEPFIEEGIGVAESMRDGNPVYDSGYNYNVSSRGYIDIFKQITKVCKRRIDAI
jgi:chromosome partitioning protein